MGTADLGIGGGMADLRLKAFSGSASFASLLPRDGDGDTVDASVSIFFTRPPDALISFNKALNPAGRVGGGIEEEEEEEEEEEGGGGGGTDLRWSFAPSFFFSSSVWLLVPSTLNSFTRPPDALISLSKALNPAGRLGGIEEEEEEEEEAAEGIADTGTGGGMDVPRTESLTDEDGSGGGCFETAGEGTTGAMEGTTRLDSIEVLLHSLAEGWTR